MSEEQAVESKRFGRRGALLGAVGTAAAVVLGKSQDAEAAVEYVKLGDDSFAQASTRVLAFQEDGFVGISERFGIFGATPDSTIFTSAVNLDAPPSARAGVLGMAALPTTPELTQTIGVFGISDGVGVRAEGTDGGLGLDVVGGARFSTAGTGFIPKGAKAFPVELPAVQSNSVVLVTLNQATNVRVKWVEKKPGFGFVVVLSDKTKTELEFSYLAVDGPQLT